ncbi:MAG: FGGY-family carbohydrate kinase [Chloroflexota bacterium]
MASLLCAVAVGTTGVKASVFTVDGEIVRTAYREHALRFPAQDRVEQEPSVLEAAFDATLQEATNCIADEIAAVAVTSARATFTAVDAAGRALTPFIIWQDPRSLSTCARLRERIRNAEYFAITGLNLEPVAVGSKAVWLREEDPAVDAATARYWLQQTYFLHRLGVEDPPTEPSMAGYYGLIDLDTRDWSPRVLEAFAINRARLPRVAQAGDVVGTVSTTGAARTGLRAGTPVVLAGSDAACCWLGAGMARDGQVTAYVGTAAALAAQIPQPLRDPEQRMTCLPAATMRTWTIEGLLLSAGAAFRWFRDALAPMESAEAETRGIDAYEVIDASARTVPAGAHGLLVVPTLVGAGAPYWEPRARGMILGLGLHHTRADIARGFMEGVALELRNALEEMRRVGVEVREVTLTGGGARSPLWNQIHADVHGVPVTTVATADPTALGAAICAGTGVGLFASLQEGAAAMARSSAQFLPDAARHERYTEMLGVYRQVLETFGREGMHEAIAALERA